ncbi:SDR family NAD(P)-dependent oxidoreductase [Mesorhizobium sp. LHD-90]|uniref:SDR family NAD(P)-dependent oxidoreductase n=1 Tax=Mesorhizobium sp. LHD-90 TaxID=3071414 RepID=UPI0027E0B2D7|nr:SDR family NAD(P)-dependent oxidoreductase [Mesorhizobium sp. LHD-90]MDQ6434498.1 SDR family NAD(P)-dependent oxidoreductase [Mesorhizobium sp. LHD-90]
MADRTVLITGATGNLGRAVAEAFSKEGARLALVGSRKESIERAYGGLAAEHLALAADLSDANAAAGVVAEVEGAFGRIDAVCAIAGAFDMGGPVHVAPPELAARMMTVNVATMVNVVRAAVPGMIARKSGKIVTVGSTAALKGAAGMGAYTASKSAVMRLTETMAAELRGDGINVNCVLPSTIDTPENRAAMPKADFSKWVKPAELAAVVAFLCSDGAKAMHGALVPVVGLV